MLQDLAKFDLVSLALAETWSEEKQADMVLKFTTALSGFLGQSLNQYFKEEAQLEFEKLIADPSVTPEKITQFYQSKIPNMEKAIDDLVLQFKRLFLLKVYENKVNQLKQEAADFQQAQEKAPDEIKLQLFQQKSQELTDWEQVLLYAQHDDWDKVAKTLQLIPH